MTQKTYDTKAEKAFDAQTAQFLGKVGEVMPRLRGEAMQAWIQQPKALGRALKWVLTSNPAVVSRLSKISLGEEAPWSSVHPDHPDEKANYDSNTKEIEIATTGIRAKGPNPLALLPSLAISLHLGVEYGEAPRGSSLELRPWLALYDEDGGEFVSLRAQELWRGHRKGVTPEHPFDSLSFLESRISDSLSDILWDCEIKYVNAAIEYIRGAYTLRLSVDKAPEGWMIYLLFLKGEVSHFSTRFSLRKEILAEMLKKPEAEAA